MLSLSYDVSQREIEAWESIMYNLINVMYDLENENRLLELSEATRVFNDEGFEHVIQSLPNLHNDFSHLMELPLCTYCPTRDKAKDIMVDIRPKLAGIVTDYELSGVGAGQCSEK